MSVPSPLLAAAASVFAHIYGAIHLGWIFGGSIIAGFEAWIVNLFESFAGGIEGALSMAIDAIIQLPGQAFAQLLQTWINSFGVYGIWIPVMLIISIVVAAFVGYFLLDFVDFDKDLAEDEEEIGV